MGPRAGTKRVVPRAGAYCAVVAHPDDDFAASRKLNRAASAARNRESKTDAAAFAVLHGLGNGILTIAIGTLPLLISGAKGYGQRQGFLMVLAPIVQAGAPFLFGLAVERWGDGALWFSAVLGLSA